MPFAQAMQTLGETETTLRRMIREGRVQAEKRRRNPDSATDFREVYEVFIPDPPADPPSDPPAPATIRHDSESEQPPDTRPDIASGLLERLAAMDATIATKDAEIARINAQALTLAERAAHAEALAAERERELERERQETARLRERRWWRWW